jgi:diguanylate cyclase (GGDEF)-like protein
MATITLLALGALASAAALLAGVAVPAELAYLVPAGFALAAWLLLRSRREIERLRIAVRESITIDELTAALNRRGLEEAGRRELLAGSRSGAPTSLIRCTVENYERLAESFGGAAAEAALITAADRLRVACRPRDRIGRVATATFAILLPECPRDAANAVVERLGTDLRAAGVATSFGVATAPEDGVTVEELLAAAAAPAAAATEAEAETPNWRPEDVAAGAYASSDAD